MGFIPEETIHQVLERCDIVEIIAPYIPLKRAGRNFKALCPFHHEKTPSFMVNPDKQIFHCFGCGVGGNVISFVMQQDRLEFPEAVRLLAQKAGVEIPAGQPKDAKTANLRQRLWELNGQAGEYFHQILMTDQNPSVQRAREYLRNRGVSLNMAKVCKLGFALDQWDHLISFFRRKAFSLSELERAGLTVVKENRDGYYDRFRNRVMFPIFDSRSHCVGFGARALDEEGGAKYINSPETLVYTKGHHLYGFHLAKDAVAREQTAIIVEGYMDFIMVFQSGIQNVVASLGTALTVEQIRLLRRYTDQVVMLFDADTAGELAVLRSLDILLEEGMHVRIAALEKNEDPDSFIRKFGVESFKKRISQAQSLFDYKLNTLLGSMDGKTIEGKAKIAQEMLATLQRFPNAVIQREYLRKLANTLHVSEQALHIELQKLSSSSKPVKMNASMDKEMEAAQNKAKTAERSILRLMLEEDEFIPLTKGEVSLSDFQDEHIKQVITRIFELFDSGTKVSPHNLLSLFDDHRILQLISSLLVAEDASIGDKRKIFQDCIQRIKEDRLRCQRQSLHQQIKVAESAGDRLKLEELKMQFNKLIQEVRNA